MKKYLIAVYDLFADVTLKALELIAIGFFVGVGIILSVFIFNLFT